MIVACIAEHLDTAKWLLSKFKDQVIEILFTLDTPRLLYLLGFRILARCFTWELRSIVPS